tara:strand:+ start:5553 stop:6074 length:522 start_codon:yes stop_codon:yes gene_type:complete
MKYIIILISLFTSISLSAQDNFVLAGGNVSWEKVYESSKTKEQIISHFERSGLFKTIKEDEETGKVYATLKPQPIDVDKTGIAGVPVILRKTDFAGTVLISFKPGKYRISYSKILLVGHGDLIKKGERQPFELHYVNKDGKAYRKYFLKRPKTIYNEHFNEIFVIEQVKKEAW